MQLRSFLHIASNPSKNYFQHAVSRNQVCTAIPWQKYCTSVKISNTWRNIPEWREHAKFSLVCHPCMHQCCMHQCCMHQCIRWWKQPFLVYRALVSFHVSLMKSAGCTAGGVENYSISGGYTLISLSTPTLISCSPILARLHLRLCKHGNHYIFLKYIVVFVVLCY